MKLNGLVYGLADAPRSWYFTFSQSLMGLGCSALNYDHGGFLLVFSLTGSYKE